MVIGQLLQEGKLKGEFRLLKAGACLYEAGNTADTFYYLLHGSVCLTSTKLGTACYRQPHTLLGLSDFIKPCYSQTATVVKEAEVVAIRKEQLQQGLQIHTELRLHFIQQMSRNPALPEAAFE